MDWLASAFIYISRYYVIKKKIRLSLVFCLFGDVLWTLVGIQINKPALIFTAGGMAIMDLWGVLEGSRARKYFESLYHQRAKSV